MQLKDGCYEGLDYSMWLLVFGLFNVAAHVGYSCVSQVQDMVLDWALMLYIQQLIRLLHLGASNS